LNRYGEERCIRLYMLVMKNPLLLKDFSQGHSRVERLRERLNRDELQLLTPFFRMNIKSENHPGQTSPEEYAAIFLNLLRGSDRLLTKKDGVDEAIRLSAISSDLFCRGIVSLQDLRP